MMSAYWPATAPQIRRAMTLQDANPASATYGCCDRTFWQYRTISSFAAATMQQLALPFAVLHTTSFAGNEWYGSNQMLDRAASAMLFWSRLPHRCGAVDEWYRHEHSYCATAFTTYGISEALLLLETRLEPAQRDGVLRALTRAGDWLSTRFNDRVMNQNLASCAALWNLHTCTGAARYKTAFASVWRKTLENQDEEGWFAEYGGADLGYSLLALELLAALDRRGFSDARAAASRLSRFVASFAVGTGDLAGRLGSRGTAHVFPFGAEALAASIPDAGRIAAYLRASASAGAIAGPAAADDRYLAYFYLPSFVLASAIEPAAAVPRAAADDAQWPNSGFRVWSRPNSSIVCSARRAAAFAVYGGSCAAHRNLGYWAETEDGRFASCPWRPDKEPVDLGDASGMRAEGRFVRVDDDLPLVRHETAFRMLAAWLFRWCAVAELCHRALKRRMTRRAKAPLRFTRELRWERDALLVRDVIARIEQGPALRTITPVDDIEVHSPSARLDGGSKMESIRVPREDAERWASEVNRAGRLTLVTAYAIDAGGRIRFEGIRMESADITSQVELERR